VVGFVSGLVRRGRFIVGTFPAMSVLSRDVNDVVELVSVHVRRGRVSVGTCSAKYGCCRYVFGDVG